MKDKGEFEYYSRHDNDGTHEAAAFCFIAAFVCIVIAAIYNFSKFLFNNLFNKF